MSLEENKAITRRYYEEVWSKGDWKAADEIVAADFSGGSLEDLKRDITAFRTAVPNLRFTVEERSPRETQWCAAGPCVGRTRASLKASLRPGTLWVKQVTSTGICIHRGANGKTLGTVSESN